MNVYPMRAVREGQWKYIRNLHPEFSWHSHIDLDTGPLAMRGFFESWKKAAATDKPAATVVRRYHARPAEELYDLTADPDEQHNLAALPENSGRLAAMRAALDSWMKTQGDTQRVYGTTRLLKDLPDMR
jgi:uncharacterized sulfatase